MTDKPEYETYSCEDVGSAWQALRKQVERGEPLTWTGPDRLHHSIAAGSPPPSEYLTDEGLEYDAERGRDIWDTLFLIAFQIGFHNGVMRESEFSAHYERLTDMLTRELEASRAKGTTLDEIARLVHESEKLKGDLDHARRRGNVYERQYRRVREERDAARQKLRDMGVAESEIRRTTPDA